MTKQYKHNHIVFCAAERSFREAYGYKYPGTLPASSHTAKVKYSAPNGASPGVGTVAPVSTDYSVMHFSSSFVLNSLRAVREPIVDYQEGRGVTRHE